MNQLRKLAVVFVCLVTPLSASADFISAGESVSYDFDFSDVGALPPFELISYQLFFQGDLYDRLVPEDQKKPGKADKLREMPLLAPVVMLVWMERQANEKIAEVEEIEAVACAVQNMHLTASARGLGLAFAVRLATESHFLAWLNSLRRGHCVRRTDPRSEVAASSMPPIQASLRRGCSAHQGRS